MTRRLESRLAAVPVLLTLFAAALFAQVALPALPPLIDRELFFGDPEISGVGSSTGVGVGLAGARFRAMKLMKFPSGDQETVSRKTQPRSGGVKFRRNKPSAE